MTKVLLVDSYDSYTYNLHQLVLDVLPDAEIVIVRNDQFKSTELESVVALFDFIIIGPGPGNPTNPSDVGFLLELFDYNVPILGVCLGFQLLCLYEGAQIDSLVTVKHGQVSALQIKTGGTLYTTTSSFPVTQYHSLFADIREIETLEELAWVEDDPLNGHITMAVRHVTKPFVGVQYHPESACSENGTELISNFLELATAWNNSRRAAIYTSRLSNDIKNQSVRPQALSSPVPAQGHVEWRELSYILPADRIAEVLGVRYCHEENFILLDAASEPSRYSILAVLSGDEEYLSYSVQKQAGTFAKQAIQLNDTDSTIWHFVAGLMQKRKVANGPEQSPFWGGLMGYVGYEAGVEGLGVRPVFAKDALDDINMVFVERSIVLDHLLGCMLIQSIRSLVREDVFVDSIWIDKMSLALDEALRTPPSSPPTNFVTDSLQVTLPDKDKYLQNISKAQSYLAEGQSYELCLTAQTKIVTSKRHPWDLYRSLRKRNPSPYAAFVKLPGICLLSSSPERFLSWNRHGECQLRPIKGTVRKVLGMTHEKAAEILRDPKEVAENLMIVDLIRHDLHQIASKVTVPALMQVEEYETVYQLVSVITGQCDAPHTGIDVLSRSLPPGSMTGAPKKRSVELLQKLEGRHRGVYSGVLGYLSVCGGGDWSVIIRSAFRYDSENEDGNESDTWWIGAGGAITAMSNAEAEWDEMMTKLQSTLPCFGHEGLVR